jgi:hypothetical protein
VDLVDPAQAIEVAVEDRHLGLHPGGDPGGVPTDVPGPEHHDAGRSNTWRPAEQDPPPPVVAFEEVGADLRRHAAGDLAHRCQQRQRAGRQLNGLVGDGRHLAVEERLADLRVGGQVEVGEQHLSFAHERELGRLRLLHLADDLGPLPHLGRRGRDLGAGPAVLVVGDRRPDPGLGFDDDGRAVMDQLRDPVGGDGDPVLVDLGLLGHADDQRPRQRLGDGTEMLRLGAHDAAPVWCPAR